MTTDSVDDSDLRLGVILRQSRPAPPLPPGFRQEVWRRIQQVEAGSRSVAVGWFDALLAWMLRPRMVLAGAAVLVLMSVLAGVLSGSTATRETARDRYLAAVAPAALP